MTEPSQTNYETVPFRGRPIPWASPAALSLASSAHGGPRLDPSEPLRVLELGCGDGAHLVPLACFRPHVHCVGVDMSPRALAFAQRNVDTLGLANVELIESDVSTLTLEGPPFDVVIAHGLYSWVDEARRAAIRRLAGRALREGGLLYLSFNAQPGWSVRGRVRDALQRSGCRTPEQARRHLEGLRALLPADIEDAWSGLLAGELDRALSGEDGYLMHEYLASHNAAFWLGDVVRDLSTEGLTYVGDATFDRREGFVPPELRAQVSVFGGDRVQRAEALDLRLYRQLHCAVFAKADALAEPPGGAELVTSSWIACAMHRRNDPFDAREGMEEIFDGPHGRETRVTSATVKMALLVLAAGYPRALRIEALHAECRDRLAEHHIGAGPIDELADALALLHAQLQVELRHEPAALRSEVDERPVAHPLTRVEAAHMNVLCTPNHVMVPIEPIDRAIIARLDGRSTASEIVDALALDISEDRLVLEGAPSGAARIRALLESKVQATITLLGWWGLVHAGSASQGTNESGR